LGPFIGPLWEKGQNPLCFCVLLGVWVSSLQGRVREFSWGRVLFLYHLGLLKRTDWWDSLKSRSVCIICSLFRHRQGASANWTGKSLYCKTHANANEIREDQVRAKVASALLFCCVGYGANVPFWTFAGW
jgi:hypothetical protein